SAGEAFRRCNLPIIVEDAGLFIDELNGFPGPYAAYIYKTLGNSGILKLLQNVANRKAVFKSVLAYYDKELNAHMCFEGEVKGKIALREQTENSDTTFGFDPIFIPSGSQKPFAQMAISEKNQYSHRAKAINKFVQWYKN